MSVPPDSSSSEPVAGPLLGSDPPQQPTPDTDRKAFPFGIVAGVAVLLVIAAVLLASGPDSPSGAPKSKGHESVIALELKARAAKEAREKKAGKSSTTATSVPTPTTSAIPQTVTAPTEAPRPQHASAKRSPRVAAAVAAASALARSRPAEHHRRHRRVRHADHVRHVRRVRRTHRKVVRQRR